MFQVLYTLYKSVVNYLYPTQPRKNIPKNIRNLTWQKYHGKSDMGVCYACNKKIDIHNWHCSHVLADKQGGLPIVANLRTCCQHCNLSCGKKNLYDYIKEKKLKGPGSKKWHQYW